MKVIKTAEFLKKAYPSVDDQPNFVDRDKSQQGCIFTGGGEESPSAIKNQWTKKKKKKQIIEEMPKESI